MEKQNIQGNSNLKSKLANLAGIIVLGSLAWGVVANLSYSFKGLYDLAKNKYKQAIGEQVVLNDRRWNVQSIENGQLSFSSDDNPNEFYNLLYSTKSLEMKGYCYRNKDSLGNAIKEQSITREDTSKMLLEEYIEQMDLRKN